MAIKFTNKIPNAIRHIELGKKELAHTIGKHGVQFSVSGSVPIDTGYTMSSIDYGVDFGSDHLIVGLGAGALDEDKRYPLYIHEGFTHYLTGDKIEARPFILEG